MFGGSDCKSLRSNKDCNSVRNKLADSWGCRSDSRKNCKFRNPAVLDNMFFAAA